MADDTRWRIALPEGDPIPFHTERGARTAAAIRSRAGRAAVVVEHLDDDGGWHPCPRGEIIPGRAERPVYTAGHRRPSADVGEIVARSAAQRERQRLDTARRRRAVPGR